MIVSLDFSSPGKGTKLEWNWSTPALAHTNRIRGLVSRGYPLFAGKAGMRKPVSQLLSELRHQTALMEEAVAHVL